MAEHATGSGAQRARTPVQAGEAGTGGEQHQEPADANRSIEPRGGCELCHAVAEDQPGGHQHHDRQQECRPSEQEQQQICNDGAQRTSAVAHIRLTITGVGPARITRRETAQREQQIQRNRSEQDGQALADPFDDSLGKARPTGQGGTLAQIWVIS
jgi:hypothetical protein